VDPFSNGSHAKWPKFWTLEDSAFGHHWGGMMLWVNPPWDLYPPVVQKLREDGAEALCIVPVWPRQPWYTELMGMRVRELENRPGIYLFELEGRSHPHTVWGGQGSARSGRGKQGSVVAPAAVAGARASAQYLRALDLFCGVKSVARVFEAHGYWVDTLDIDPDRRPTVCVDILDWNYRAAYAPGTFDLIAAPPPCKEYSMALNASIAKHGRVRRLAEAVLIVRRTLEVIEYLRPRCWWLETPGWATWSAGILCRGTRGLL
jgi:hypothetical protein